MSDTNIPIRPGTYQATLEVNNESDRDTIPDVPNLHRQFQPDHFQAGAFPGQSSGSNEYGFIQGGNTKSVANYPDGGTSTVPNMQAASMQEQNSFHISGGNEMFNIPKRSFPPNAQPYPQFTQPAFGNAPPTSQNTRLSFKQIPQNLSSGLAEAVNRSPFLRQPSQPTPQPTPQPQPVTPPPRQIFPFWGFYFRNFDQVNTYLNGVAWFPSMGRYGLPQSAEQYKFYIEKICSALLSLQNVWDIETAPWQLGKFLPNGEWTDARDTEAIAHIIVLAGMRIHVSGVTDFAHTRSIDYMSFNSEDIDFTFPQRMHFLAILLDHSKAAAAEVMARVNIDKYVTAPITALRRFETFEETWKNASPEEKKNLLEVQPYVGSGVTHPPPELQAQLTAMAATRYRQLWNAQHRRDPGTDSTERPTGQTPGDQGGSMPQRWPPAPKSEQGSPSTPRTNAGQDRAQVNARAAMPGGNERFQCTTPHPGQNPGEGVNSPDTAGI